MMLNYLIIDDESFKRGDSTLPLMHHHHGTERVLRKVHKRIIARQEGTIHNSKGYHIELLLTNHEQRSRDANTKI